MILKNNFSIINFDNLPFGVIITDKKGKVLYLNSSAKDILKIESNSLNDQTCIKEALEPINAEKNGIIDINTTEISLDKGICDLTILYKSKLDEEKLSLVKSMEEQLYQYKNLASIGTMISGIAHELNNPISGISMSYQMAERLISELKDHISNRDTNGIDKNFINNQLDNLNNEMQDIKTNVVKSSKLIGDLLNFSKKERLELSLYYLNEIIEDVIRFGTSQNLFKLANISIDCPKDIKLCCDKLKIQQAIYNLVKNAVESVSNNADIKVLCTEENSLISIKIVDNGIGIPNEIIGQLFNPFFTTKGMKGGTGLGLSISQRLIERHGGKIALETSVGEGSVFTIILPNNLE